MPNLILPAVNQRVDIWFDGYDKYYGGRVDSVSPPYRFHVILDDNSSWDVDSRKHIYRLSEVADMPNNANTHSIPPSSTTFTDETVQPTVQPRNTRSSTRLLSKQPTQPQPQPLVSDPISDPALTPVPDLAEQKRNKNDTVLLATVDNETKEHARDSPKPNASPVFSYKVASHKDTSEEGKPAPVTTESLIHQENNQAGGENIPDPATHQISSPGPLQRPPSNPPQRRFSGRALRKNTSTSRPQNTDVQSSPTHSEPVPRRHSVAPLPQMSEVQLKMKTGRPSRPRRASSRLSGPPPGSAPLEPPARKNRKERASSTSKEISSQRGSLAQQGRKRLFIVNAEKASGPERELPILKRRKLNEDRTAVRKPAGARKSLRPRDTGQVTVGSPKLPPQADEPPPTDSDESPIEPERPGPESSGDNPIDGHRHKGNVRFKHSAHALTSEAITAIAVDAAFESARAVLDPINERLTKLLDELGVVSKDIIAYKKVLEDRLLVSPPAPRLSSNAGQNSPSNSAASKDTSVVPHALQNFKTDMDAVIGEAERHIKTHSSQFENEFKSLHQMIVRKGEALKKMGTLVTAVQTFVNKSTSKTNGTCASVAEHSEKGLGDSVKDDITAPVVLDETS